MSSRQLPVAPIAAALGVTAAAVRHLGWWLDWQARARPSEGSRPGA